MRNVCKMKKKKEFHEPNKKNVIPGKRGAEINVIELGVKKTGELL